MSVLEYFGVYNLLIFASFLLVLHTISFIFSLIPSKCYISPTGDGILSSSSVMTAAQIVLIIVLGLAVLAAIAFFIASFRLF
eukprot:UN03108